MTDSNYQAQLAEVRRRGWRTSVITLPFVAVGIALAIYVNGIIGDLLDASLYGPVCKTTRRELDGRTIGHRLGGRGRSGEVDCQCLDTKDSWHEADLSGGSSVDLALHYGGQEVLSVGTLIVLGLTSLVVGSRLVKSV